MRRFTYDLNSKFAMIENLFIRRSRCQDGCHKDSSYKGRSIFVWLDGGLSSFAQSMEKSQ